MSGVYYNEIEKFPCDVIRHNIARGRLPQGFVDEKDIRTVKPTDLVEYRQFHLFAGIGVAAYACALAGIPIELSLLTAGFPCQDISCAGAQAGIEGERSGLFWHLLRIIEDIRPTWLLLENVANLRTAGATKDSDGIAAVELVIHGLEGAGYTVLPPVVVGADDIAAPHRRKRVWIVARLADTGKLGWESRTGLRGGGTRENRRGFASNSSCQAELANAHSGVSGTSGPHSMQAGPNPSVSGGSELGNAARSRTRSVSAGQRHQGTGASDTDGTGVKLADSQYDAGSAERWPESRQWKNTGPQQITVPCRDGELADSNGSGWGEQCATLAIPAELTTAAFSGSEFRWPSRPGEPQHEWEAPRTVASPLGSAVDGPARRLARLAVTHRRNALKGLGNAWVPWCAVPILRWIYETEMSL